MPNVLPESRRPLCPECGVERLKDDRSRRCNRCRCHPGWHGGERIPAQDGPPPSTLFDERWQTFNKWIGRTPKPVKVPPEAKPSDTCTIVHLTDIHVPYQDEDALRWAVESTRGADICVVGGDFFNAGAFSRFIESDFIPPRDEFASARLVLEYIAGAYPRVILRPGNHTDRIRKYFGARIPPYMLFLVHMDPLKFVATDIPNIEVAGPAIDGVDNTEWLTILGDCVFTHGESASSVLMRPADNVRKWLRRWAAKLPMPNVVCQEHNHSGGMAPCRDDPSVLLIQTPCLSQDVAYQGDSRMRYGPNQIGYTTIVQRNGVTDWNTSRYFLRRDAESEAA